MTRPGIPLVLFAALVLLASPAFGEDRCSANEDVTFEAAEGSLLDGKLVGAGLEPGRNRRFGPTGDVVLELRGKTGKWSIPTTTLTAGTGPYTLRIGVTEPVKWTRALKLPKKQKAAIGD